MTDESPISATSENSPLSHKRRIDQNLTLNVSLELDSSTLELGASETQQTQSFSEQSPKKPKFCSLNHSLTTDEDCIVDDIPQVVEKQFNLDGGKVLFEGKCSEGDQLGGQNLNVGDKTEVSELGLLKNDEGTEQKEIIEDLSGEKLNLDDKNEVSDMGLVENSACFEQKEVIDEFLGVKDEKVALECDKKDENVDGVLPNIAKSEDSTKSLMIEVIDGTALVDVSLVEDKQNRRRVNNHKKSNSRNTASVSGVLKEFKKRCVYSRKELEVLRYVNVKAQRKFWQEIYNGFSATVKKEYDEVGSFRHKKRGGSSSDYNKNGGMRNCNNEGIMGTCSSVPSFNNRGILGVAAARGRCYNPNIFVYKRKRIDNCKALSVVF